MKHRSPLGLVLGLSLFSGALSGCGASGARYSGVEEPPIVTPPNVEIGEAIPPGYSRIGSASARCSKVLGYQALDDEPFANLDCTTARLDRALRVAAAAAGGSLLVGRRCTRVRDELECKAGVARPDDETLSRQRLALGAPAPRRPAPSAWEVMLQEEPHITRSFEIFMNLEPRAISFERAPRAVIEVGALPPHHVALGDLGAHCELGVCAEGELVQALRVTAGRFGADSLAGVRCFASRDRLTCVGTLGATPIDSVAEGLASTAAR